MKKERWKKRRVDGQSGGDGKAEVMAKRAKRAKRGGQMREKGREEKREVDNKRSMRK